MTVHIQEWACIDPDMVFVFANDHTSNGFFQSLPLEMYNNYDMMSNK